MANFSVDFSYYPTILSAPAKVDFESSVSGGVPISGATTTTVDVNGNEISINGLYSDYFVARVEQWEWKFSDGSIFGESAIKKTFEFSGDYEVTLSVFSNIQYDTVTNKQFRFKVSVSKDIVLKSMVASWLVQHMAEPQATAIENNQTWTDLINASSKMFDRMYKEIKQVADLTDIKVVAPKFLEYYSDTLNHKRFYASKVGYAQQLSNEFKQTFLDYDFFDRVSKDTASEEEIKYFREFIMHTVDAFKKNGSKESLQDFYKLYGFVVKIKELWTENFGDTYPNLIVNNFFFDPTLENTESNFKYKGVSVIGLENDKSQFISEYNSLKIDNYHYCSTHSLIEFGVSGQNCTTIFEINDTLPYVTDIIRDDGRTLDNKYTCSGFDATSLCSSAAMDSLVNCKENNFSITKNENWVTSNRVSPGVIYKFWQAPINYVQNLITLAATLGTFSPGPSGEDEIAEIGLDGNTSDDYRWADWKTGVIVPDSMSGVSSTSLKKPNLQINLPYVNYSTTVTDNNLIQVEDFPISTTSDFFVTSRGFVEIPKDGYYVFSMDVGNVNTTGDETSSVGLFSLKHGTKYTREQLNTIYSLDDLTFTRNNSDVATSISGDSGEVTLYGKAGEYGIIEIRPNELEQDSGYYYLQSGFYAFETKASYSTRDSKKLKLYWSAVDQNATTHDLESILDKAIIPSSSLYTLNKTVDELTIEETTGKGLLTIDNSLIEGGDILSVGYTRSQLTDNHYSGIVSTSELKLKNFEMEINFSPKIIDSIEQNHNTISQSNKIMPFFRGISRKKNRFLDIDTYYGVVLNGNSGEISVVQVSYNENIDAPYFKYLNLNPNLNAKDKIVTSIQLYDSLNYALTLSDSNWYSLKIKVVDDKISVYFRDNTNLTTAISSINLSQDYDITSFDDTLVAYTTVIENITLNQDESMTVTKDSNENTLDISDKYEYISDAGNYGLAVKASIFKINQFNILPLDKVDDNLVESIDKWKQFKPRYLDSKNKDLLRFNSQGVIDINGSTSDTFRVKVSDSYDGTVNKYPLPQSVGVIDDNSVNKVVVNNVNASDWGSRFNVLVDKDYINSKFKTTQQILDSLVVAYGNFYEPFVNWSATESLSGYGEEYFQAGFTPCVKETIHLMPHTVAVSGSTVFYPTEMTRISGSPLISLNGPIKTLLNSTTNNSTYGFWEELSPFSSEKTWTVKIKGQTKSFSNEVFEIIYRDKTTQSEKIGVRITNKDTLDKLMCRYCKDAVVYGLYEITLPNAVVKNHPFTPEVAIENNKLRYFVPIGKLNTDYYYFLPPPEILKNSSATINLLGVYAQHGFEGFTLTSDNTYKITELSYWENKYKSAISCKYFLDIETSFIDKFTEFNVAIDQVQDKCGNSNILLNSTNGETCVLPNAFKLPNKVSKIIKYLETKIGSSYTNDDFSLDYNWWVPKKLWLERKFDVGYSDNTNDELLSGLNVPNNFYSSTPILSAGGTKLSFIDNIPSDTGRYILDVQWCASSAGWDAEYAISGSNSYAVGIFNSSEYSSKIGFISGSKLAMGQEKIIPLGSFLSAPIPIQTIYTSGASEVSFNSYSLNASGTGKTFIPVGLFNWFLTHSNETTKVGWEVSDFNNEFVQGVKFNKVYSEIDTSLVKINKFWAFNQENIPKLSSIVKVERSDPHCYSVNGSNSPATTTNFITLGLSDGESSFFAVPPIIEYYPKWVQYVNSVLIDNYELPNDYYSITTDTDAAFSNLSLNNQTFDFTPFVGNTQFNVELSIDKVFDSTSYTEFVDNFDNKREINWVTLLESNNYYSVGKRLPDSLIKIVGNSAPYDIVSYKNAKAFKLVNKFDYDNPSKFSGGIDSETSVGIDSNHGSINVIQVIDTEASNFSLSTDVIFDTDISNTDLDKHFELILKGENNLSRKYNQFGLTDFYYVGIGANNWDISLGMRSIDTNTLTIKDTLLANWGEYNVRNIQSNVWYTLKATVSNTEIKIYFHEKSQPEKIVLTYNINKKYEKFTERYLKGEFENLQAIIVGLKELGIDYPSTIGDSVSTDYTFKHFNAEFAGTLPINGTYSGVRVFNDLTYFTNVKFKVNYPTQYKFGGAYDTKSFNSIINDLTARNIVPKNPEVNKVLSGLNFTDYVLINDTLFYKFQDKQTEIYPRPVIDIHLVDTKVIIIEKELKTDCFVGTNALISGGNQFIWSLSDNTQNLTTMYDFFDSVPSLTSVNLVRNNITYTAIKSGPVVSGSDLILVVGDSITLNISSNRVVVWPLGGTVARYNIFVRMFEEGLIKEYPILIKDKTFYKDSLKSYMEYADKKIKEVHINDGKLNILFEDN